MNPPVINLMMVPVVVVLLCLLLLLIPYSTSADAAADSTRNIALPGCQANCGNWSIPYPFGLKPGCFRSADFHLTCNNHKLFLGALEINEDIDLFQGTVSINAPIFTMSAEDDHYTAYWKPPLGGYYAVASAFNVVGCGIYAYLADSVTGEILGMCLSVCANNQSDSAAFVGEYRRSGNGYCSVSVPINSTAKEYEIRLDRLYGESRGSGKAFMTTEDYRFSKEDLISSDLIGGSSVIPLWLEWEIRERSSCTEAKRNMSTYACRSNYSFCLSDNEGYLCMCSSWFETDFNVFNSSDGNPYISGGCPAPALVNDEKHCLRTCGNISVPYPFGLEVKCARDADFWLRCNTSQLSFNYLYQVTEIMLEEGQLQILDDLDPIAGMMFETDYFTRSQPTIMLDWVVGYVSCGDAKKSNNFACNYSHSECHDLTNFKYNYNNTYGPAYRCKCSLGYQGNPYTAQGCIDINECNYPEKYKCSAGSTCINSAGSFDCRPSSGSGGLKRGLSQHRRPLGSS